MPNITMTFPNINDSVQIGDTIYYQNTSGTIIEMGTATAVTATTISCNIGGTVVRPTANDFMKALPIFAEIVVFQINLCCGFMKAL